MDDASLGMFGLYLVSLASHTSLPADQPQVEADWAARLYFDADKWYWTSEARHLIEAVLDAMRHGKSLHVDHVPGRGGSRQSQEVEPYGLVWKSGNYYLVARMQDGAMLSLRLDRVQRATETEHHFTFPGAGFDLRAWWRQSLEDFGKGDTRVILRGSGHGASRLRSLTLKSTSRTQDQANGDVVITLYVDNWDWLIPLACQFGDEVEVVEPAELRTAVADRLLSAVRMYGRDPELL